MPSNMFDRVQNTSLEYAQFKRIFCQTSKIDLFVKILNSFQPLPTFEKSTI